MDLGLGGAAGRAGSGGGGARGMSGSGGSRDSPFAIGGGGASAAAWTRLVSSGVEDELVAASGGGGRSGAGAGGLPLGHFLEACFLCRKPLPSNRDIFMYRGDIPFCTEECRREQIEMDEEMERKESSTPKKVAARAPVESPPRPPKARAGSILAG
ncbi:hypothetical protein GQ55_7G260200 [Panicum hallii var. hallii]|uniref:FLZ-type domain-containing protein n=2 Tax=Panicum hallii TaxID=206008 RepID=A0A2T7CZ53_9POAL|nr:uncharacterized protein LOC112899894 [Panicum hallii]PAN39792.1 hypothetical protein PAHAL_7G268300 [Panicum hallii]PUZ48628.1 hypothetical protein GQ55_7G260200 [Panicum hallii var. hallii]